MSETVEIKFVIQLWTEAYDAWIDHSIFSQNERPEADELLEELRTDYPEQTFQMIMRESAVQETVLDSGE